MTRKKLYTQLYQAFYKAAEALDGDYKQLSMFGHWKKKK